MLWVVKMINHVIDDPSLVPYETYPNNTQIQNKKNKKGNFSLTKHVVPKKIKNASEQILHAIYRTKHS